MTPYIGISGLNNESQAKEIITHFQNLTSDHQLHINLMIGILSSDQSINNLNNSQLYPRLEEFNKIFRYTGSNIVRLVHYNTSNEYSLVSELEYIGQRLHNNFAGFQLNLEVVRSSVLSSIRQSFPYKNIILQFNKEALGDFENTIGRILPNLDKNDVNSIVINPIDKSDNEFDLKKALDCIQLLQFKSPKTKVTIEGFLGPDNLNILARPVVNKYNKLISINAQSTVRDSKDNLDIEQAKSYITKGFSLYL